MPGFQRVNPIGDAFIRGPARLLIAPITQAFPPNLDSVINLPGGTPGLWTPTAEVQTLTITGTPTGGTFQLSFQSVQTAPIAYNATAAAVVAALVALPGIGAAGVTGTGGPLPTTPVVITFAGVNTGAQPIILAQSAGLTGGTTPIAAVARTTPGVGLYDPASGWTELGSTKGGVQITRNNTESLIDVDQILAALTALPDEWEGTIATSLAETTLENIQIAWEGGSITTDVARTPNQRHLGIGQPVSYVPRRLAVLHQKSLGTSQNRIRGFVARSVLRSPQNSSLDYVKNGNQQTLPHTFRMFADQTVSDPAYRFGEFIEEQAF